MTDTTGENTPTQGQGIDDDKQTETKKRVIRRRELAIAPAPVGENIKEQTSEKPKNRNELRSALREQIRKDKDARRPAANRAEPDKVPPAMMATGLDPEKLAKLLRQPGVKKMIQQLGLDKQS